MRPHRRTMQASLRSLHKTIIHIQDDAWLVRADKGLSKIEKAVIALEDRRFFSHIGFDYKSFLREFIKLLLRKRHGGASTIDIQLFRTYSGRYERTFRRKIRETVGAYALQKKLSKLEILRIYLNSAYFGTNIVGVDQASKVMFKLSKDDLNLDQACAIASMLVYPKPRIPSSNWHAKINRRADYGALLVRAGEKSFYKLPS